MYQPHIFLLLQTNVWRSLKMMKIFGVLVVMLMRTYYLQIMMLMSFWLIDRQAGDLQHGKDVGIKLYGIFRH